VTSGSRPSFAVESKHWGWSGMKSRDTRPFVKPAARAEPTARSNQAGVPPVGPRSDSSARAVCGTAIGNQRQGSSSGRRRTECRTRSGMSHADHETGRRSSASVSLNGRSRRTRCGRAFSPLFAARSLAAGGGGVNECPSAFSAVRRSSFVCRGLCRRRSFVT